jgi:UrcA family protein
MTYSTSVRRGLPLAFAVGAFALMGARARAANTDSLDPVQLDPITVSAPAVKIVGRDSATGAPIEDVTIDARVQVDPEALKTNYGALMLKYSVQDAAREACAAADPVTQDDGTCFQKAVHSAEPQIDAAIARARSN